MSADNYYMIRKHPNGKYVALMGFASDPTEPTVEPDREYEFFDDPMDAFFWAQGLEWPDAPEYGVSIHPECNVRKISKSDP